MKRLTLAAAAVCTFAFAGIAAAEPEAFHVNNEAGNSTMTAVFDAPLGERITGLSHMVGCDLTFDAKTNLASGTCTVPLTSITVDSEPTKTEHFQQWVTNKKSEPKACAFEARFNQVKLPSAMKAEQAEKFEAEVPFTVCGRARADGKPEHVTGTVVLFPPGSYGEQKTIRVRAHVEKFNRDAYKIGPKYTDGWLARVQGLAKVVADEGTIDLNLFAVSAVAKAPAK
jgi:hypothetical protein